MTTPDKKNIAGMSLSAVGLALLVWLIATIQCGCKAPPTPNPAGNTIPAFEVFEPGIARGGEPRSAADWAWLKSHGYTNVVTFHTSKESQDSLAEAVGLTVHRHPIDTIQQLSTGPNEAEFKQAVSEIKPGTFVHCRYGRDRTSFGVAFHDMAQGTNAADAWDNMIRHGYRPAEFGLTLYFYRHTGFTNAAINLALSHAK